MRLVAGRLLRTEVISQCLLGPFQLPVDLVELAVVSYQELTSEINIQPLAKIEI